MTADTHRPCEQCGAEFEPHRTTRRYCTPVCRKRAQRDRKKAAAAAAAQAEQHPTEAEAVEGLVAALRVKLDGGGPGVAESFEGQLALQLASKIANPGESGVATLAKVLLTVVDTAMAGTPVPDPSPEPADPPPDLDADADEDELRRLRELKLAGVGPEADRA